MAYLFTSNEWVYYSAILLCMFVAIILYALEGNRPAVMIGPYAQEYLLYFHLQAKDGGLYYTTDLINGMDLGGEVVESGF